jgi:dTDP-4-dehydrorhamnose reductase
MIWLIGNKGMLGMELSLLLEKTRLPYTGTDREIDITDLVALQDFASTQPIGWIINCAAYTAVDKAEDDQAACHLINTIGAANIAKVAKTIRAKLIHISTDYVFDGSGNRPYTEEDPTCPIGVYGLTKRDGEDLVLNENPLSYIIRTAWLYGRYGNNFVNTMLRLMNEKEEVKVVKDQYGNPTWAFDLSETILALIQQTEGGKNISVGIYHFANEEKCTWFEFAEEIYQQGRELNLISKDCVVKPCISTEYPARVNRPAYSVLDKSKIKKTLGLVIPSWNDSLKKYFKLIAERN